MNRFGSRTVLLIALVAAIIGGIATYSVSALTSTARTEVRITAQRVDDGRVELALQQRQDDGSWGDRLLPARRFFPDQGFVNRWANSSPLEIDSGIPFYVNTTEPTRSMTADEYIALCGNDEWLLGEAIVTLDKEGLAWGDLFSLLDPAISKLRSIEAPDELAEYHQSQLSTVTLMAQYAFAQDPDAELDLWEFFAIALIAAGFAEEAETSLDPDLRQRLVDGGCIEAEESGFDE